MTRNANTVTCHASCRASVTTSSLAKVAMNLNFMRPPNKTDNCDRGLETLAATPPLAYALNADTIREMRRLRQGGREANDGDANATAAFLKLLVLLVPREMKVEHTERQGMTMRSLSGGSRRSAPCSRLVRRAIMPR